MNTNYDNLLIPVDRSLNSQKAIAKALELARPWRATIHLVHLVRSWNPINIFKPEDAYGSILDLDIDGYLKALIDLMHWKDLIESSGNGIAVRLHIKRGFSLQSLVLRTIRKEKVRLVIMACHSKRKWFSLGNNISVIRLAQESGCRILSITTERQGEFDEEVDILSKLQFKEKEKAGNVGFSGTFLKHFFRFLLHNGVVSRF